MGAIKKGPWDPQFRKAGKLRGNEPRESLRTSERRQRRRKRRDEKTFFGDPFGGRFQREGRGVSVMKARRAGNFSKRHDLGLQRKGGGLTRKA